MTGAIDQLLAWDVPEAARRLRDGSVTAVELTRAYLDRISRTEPNINAYVTVDTAGALEGAHQADHELGAGRDRGSLHGIPVGVKDLIDTGGLRTTYGSGRFADHVPAKDAAVVRLVRESGAVVLGKQATHEFAWGGRTDGRHFGPTRNPHDVTRVPGGSTGGGGASVAVGSCLVAVGTDTAGSVRIPAAFCGCVGFKPTRAWASMDGVHPLAPSLDHIGLLGRTVAGVSLAAAALGGPPVSAGRSDVAELRIGLPAGRSLAGLDPVVRSAWESAVRGLERRGAVVVSIADEMVDERVLAILTLVRAEAYEIHRSAFEDSPGAFGDDLAELLAMGPVDPATRAAAASVARSAVDELVGSFSTCDVVLTPTVPTTAPPIGAVTLDLDGVPTPVELVLTRLTSLADAAGVPAISVPASSLGLPVGLQLMAPQGEDGRLLGVAAAVGEVIGRSRCMPS